MSWFTPVLLSNDERSVSARVAADGFHARLGGGSSAPHGAGLGCAHASGEWAWSSAPAWPARPARPAQAVVSGAAGACLRAPVEVLSRMSEAARALGRSESDVWVEAAREWLRRHEVEPATPPAAPARSAAPRRASRVWDDIDALLIELRTPARPSECEGVPAA